MSDDFKIIRATLAKLVSGELGTYEWDDSMSAKSDDPSAEALRRIAWQLGDLFPPTDPREFCSAKGVEFAKLLLDATSSCN